ncbi:MAG TPA: ABC transporter permease subunit [Thermoanaerobaculia bacterium]|jgi:NitT/TauT family transport system permease protein|nr:ABC transporter permease subunit [Thermoanaerobaculia bacterium]
MIKPTPGPAAASIFEERRPGASWADLLMVGFGLALFYGILTLARTWLGPFTPNVVISVHPSALPGYTAYSLLRMAVAYVLSIGFSLVYGYVAAYYPKAERLMIPLLDIMQSIPVLSFLPGVMLAMIALFPHSQIGVELGAILLIFTGQVWNIAFSFYASLKAIPTELREAARIYRFNAWQRLIRLELPFSALGLVWNSMVSVATGWFFLMVCEMFPLGKTDFRLPGLGSYLQTAASDGNTAAILWGLLAMVSVIVLIDQLIWRPVIAWADKFKFEQVEGTDAPQSAVLDLVQRSPTLAWLRLHAVTPLGERLNQAFCRRAEQHRPRQPSRWAGWLGWLLGAALIAAAAWALVHVAVQFASLDRGTASDILRGTGATLLRVFCALALGAAWAIPAGVAIGSSPRLARIAQPIVQVAASVPATALFPVVLMFLIGPNGGLGVAPLVLMLLGTQWYILFNVIAGAMGIPSDLKEVARVFRFGRLDRWRLLILPGIFPYLVTGMVTAAGGAWNASIVAEYFHFKGRTLQATGLGSLISAAADAGDFNRLLIATVVLASIVVVTNRLVWRRLYRIAETRFRLET